ncbi:hypothetical protein CL652_00035 [bacterium]|nr:hypothetical protein [bacterium]|tara:strand:- start:2734 stop:3285 length:552 start_codon:yes stop_codon:yes gene_type:complete
MKWLSLIIGGAILAGGIWFLLSPNNADGPSVEDSTIERTSNPEQQGIQAEGELQLTVPATGLETSVAAETEVIGEPTGDPIFHALVEYTDGGFSPASVTINKGETVRFVNNSSQPLWVSSAVHPTHSVYPEKSEKDCLGSSFDTCRVLQAAEFWEFTFDYTGEWRYHNHVRPQDIGSIVVVEQ